MYASWAINPTRPTRLILSARFRTACALLVVIWPTAHAEPAPDAAKRWLERMLQAAQTLNYEGTFVYVRGPHVETLRIVHGAGEQGRRQQLVSLSGAQREVFSGNQHVICRLAKQQATFTSQASQDGANVPFPLFTADDVKKLENYYRFEVLHRDRVAGLDTQVIGIIPKDQWRLGYRLWLDQRNGLVLRSTLLDERNTPIEQVIFTDLQLKDRVDVPDTPAPEHAPKPVPTAPVTPATRGASTKGAAVRFGKIPQGFEQVSHYTFSKAAGQYPIEQVILADGLATVSVFVEPLNGGPPVLQGASRIGSMSAFGIARDDHQVLVIGEVPAITVETIAQEVQPKTAVTATAKVTP